MEGAMSLRDEIANLIHRETADYATRPACYRCEDTADAVLNLLRGGKWFDEAVERMLDYEMANIDHNYWTLDDENDWRARRRPSLTAMLLAAAGGDV